MTREKLFALMMGAKPAPPLDAKILQRIEMRHDGLQPNASLAHTNSHELPACAKNTQMALDGEIARLSSAISSA
jgi:hypothetical protein